MKRSKRSSFVLFPCDVLSAKCWNEIQIKVILIFIIISETHSSSNLKDLHPKSTTYHLKSTPCFSYIDWFVSALVQLKPLRDSDKPDTFLLEGVGWHDLFVHGFVNIPEFTKSSSEIRCTSLYSLVRGECNTIFKQLLLT